jgi:hypothetical protein
MFKSDSGDLTVWLRQNNVDDRILWSRAGDFGNFWRYGHVTVQAELDFQLAFQGSFFFTKSPKLI